MSKTVKKRQPFRIPTVEEVIEFMDKSMKDWPRAFCEYYGKKFWHSYQSKSWQISRGCPMKDWHAAFFANWQDVNYPNDKKMLETCLQSLTHRLLMDQRRRESAGLFAVVEGEGPTPLQRTLEFLDGIMAAYVSGTASEAQLRTAAEWLSKRELLRLKKDQKDRILVEQGNDRDRGRILAVKQFFENLRAGSLTVAQYYFSRISPVESKTNTA